ncbi:hypothetical protein WJX77_009198 [Trebouxia sp. C0004]
MQWMQQAVSKLVGQYSPGPQQQKGMLSKEQLTKFFTASTDLLETAAVKKELKTAADQGQDPEEIITDLQKELFKAQGIDGVFGIECLGQVGDAYQDDTDFMRLFVSSVEREEEAVNEAELSPEEFQIRKERMKAMREQNDALVAQMEGMSHEEQQHFLTAQVKERLDQLPPAEREEALQALMGHQCGDSCSHDHRHEEPHVHGPNCTHDSQGTIQEADEAIASPSDSHHM